MRVGALVVAGLCAVGAATAAQAADAASGPSVESGSWNEPAVGSVAIPSTTPSGQLQVSYGFDGPLEISAIRFAVPAGTDGSDQVTIRLATTGAMVGTPTVSACPTTSSWKPSDSGAPAYNCGDARQAVGAPESSDETWTFPVAWASKGVIAVALVPTVGTTSPFSISYTAPTAASITFATPTAPPTNPSGPVAPPVTSPTAVSVPSGPPATFASPSVGTGSGGVPVVTVPSVPVPAPNLGSLPASTNSGSGPAPVAAPASQAAGGLVSHTPQRRGARILAFVLLLATGAALFRGMGKSHRAPRSLLPRRYGAPVAEPVLVAGGSAGGAREAGGAGEAGAIRGIGRFAKARTAPPTRI